MTNLKGLFVVINAKTITITFLALLSTYICLKYDIKADFPLTLLATAVVFPIVFSIGGAYKRRESALNEYAAIKGNGQSIYYAVRDWVEGADEKMLERARAVLGNLLRATDTMLSGDISNFRERETKVYESFSDLSAFIREELRGRGLAGGEVSRVNQYLSKMMVAFEKLKHIYQYRTPRTLRTFSDLFIKILPPLYGPYFAHVADKYTPGYGLEYITPVLFTLVLVSLDNIQNNLENPFDKIGRDDITISVDEYVSRLR